MLLLAALRSDTKIVISPPGIILMRLLDLLEQVFICLVLRTDFMNVDVD